MITKTLNENGTSSKVLRFTQTEVRKLSQAADVLIAAGRHDTDAEQAYAAIESLIQRLVDGLFLQAVAEVTEVKEENPQAMTARRPNAVADPAKK